jgi:hypothetical protein
MTTRAELIARLLRKCEDGSLAEITEEDQQSCADMLEADEQDMKDAFASGMSCRPASVQQCDKLREAARLALDALLKKNGKWGQGHDELEAKAVATLTEALK